PDINESDYRFTPYPDMKIRYALGAIKGTGEAAVESITAARQSGGKFTGLLDFCERVGKEHMNRRTLEALIRGGAFDSIEPNRAMLLANIDLAMNNADQKAANTNQGGLFDMMEDAIEPVRLIDAPMWSESEKLAEEKTVIGFYLSGHPFGPYAQEVRQIAPTKLGRLKPQDSVRLAGFVTAVRTMMGKRGKIAFVSLEDLSGQVEIMVGGQTLENCTDCLKADQVLIIESKVSRDDYGGDDGLRILANQVMTLQTARERYARSLSLALAPHHDIGGLVQLLAAHQLPDTPRIPLQLSYANEKASGRLQVPPKWTVTPSSALFGELETLLGSRSVRVNW
ncbi:TPA: DNA polymerase III subunit alpha, partial [Neisseria meningitidis]